MNVRHKRLESVIHRGVQSVVNEGFNDPRLDDCILTVTSVKIDNDVTTAVIGVSVLPERAERRAIAALKSAARHVRRETADRVNVHRMPAFHFKIDAAAKRQRDVLEALAKARAETEPAHHHDAGPPNDQRNPPAPAAHTHTDSTSHPTDAAPDAADQENPT